MTNTYDDMTYMASVFMPIDRDKPALPYDEFITEGGLHPRLERDDRHGGHFYALYEFPNGNRVSVICGALFYSRTDAPYEARLNDYEPEGCLTDEDLMILLAKAIGDIK